MEQVILMQKTIDYFNRNGSTGNLTFLPENVIEQVELENGTIYVKINVKTNTDG